jgi:hypothetical protein
MPSPSTHLFLIIEISEQIDDALLTRALWPVDTPDYLPAWRQVTQTPGPRRPMSRPGTEENYSFKSIPLGSGILSISFKALHRPDKFNMMAKPPKIQWHPKAHLQVCVDVVEHVLLDRYAIDTWEEGELRPVAHGSERQLFRIRTGHQNHPSPGITAFHVMQSNFTRSETHLELRSGNDVGVVHQVL